ncbi:mechanosensitive ion channel domain-containing protein [Granulosicoccus sp. 3-233]|uniref:mechanosensitive ion channel domain-containing protein n=1 Tax=Granulosicoccus sp. 3-233 TaxID=3417969 RepID=UPI003D34D453
MVVTGSRRLLVLILSMMFALGSVKAATPPPDEQELNELEDAIANTADLSEQDSGQLVNELKLARRQLTGLQQRRSDIDGYLQQVADYDAKVNDLQSRIQALLETGQPRESLPGGEAELAAAAAEQEASVRESSQELYESRETEAHLSERAAAITRQMAMAAAQIDASSSLSSDATADWQQNVNSKTTALVERTRAFLSRVQSHVALESINLQQVELSTLAPRQTLASLNSRLLQMQLDAELDEQDRLWSALNDARVSRLRDEIAAHTDETSGRETGSRDVMQLLRARLSLLEKELPLLQQTSSVSQSILDIYQIRLILMRVTNTGSVNDALAVTVRQLREQLPDEEAMESQRKALRNQLQKLQVNQILWEAELNNFQTRDQLGGTIVYPTDLSLTEDSLAQQVALLNVANRVSDRMVTLEAALSEALIRASQVRTTLDGNVLWLRTNDAIGLPWISYGYGAVQWLLAAETWRGLDTAFKEALQLKIITLIPLALCLLGLLVMRPHLKTLLRRRAGQVGNVGEDDYWVTPMAFLYSLMLALPLPLLLYCAYSVARDVFVFAGSIIPAIAASLLLTSLSLVTLLFFKSLCRENGVFRAHFSWNDHAVQRLNRHLNWFVWPFALSAAAYTFAITSGRSDLRYALGINAFVLISLGLSLLLYVLFHPHRGVAFDRDAPSMKSPFTRLGIWTLIVLPAFIGLLPLIGYFDTAAAIQSRLCLSALLLMAVLIIVDTLFREFMVAHRRMSLRKARAKRSALEAERNAQETTPVSGDATPDLSFAWDDDYKHTANEAQQLLRLAGIVLFLLGVWAVWKPMFPVLDNFNDIVLWQAATTADGSAVTAPVTLGKLLFAGTLLLVGFVGARNLRSVLELLLFERLKLDTGTRYAVNAIASYVLLGTTLLIAIAQLGVDWSRLQWIVAALGVGLGFGLQEIVANFISGLIILFERPVRVGDTVTIGGISGTVSNIQIRATTLTDFDNREVVLPNKSIITEDVTNWTLHDSVTRIMLTIGVAYGSDIKQVRQLLIDCVESTEHVLDSPEPTVFFVNHGASSLIFEIRAFVATPAYRLPVTHDLNSAINRKLADHGVEIPFPQQVLHMASDKE